MKLLASDLDRTLVHPVREGVGVPIERYKGEWITSMSKRSMDLLGRVGRHPDRFVPVTTRTREQFERLTPIVEAAVGWAICANGSTVLHGGERAADWDARVEAAKREAAPIDELVAAMPTDAGFVLKQRIADEAFWYAVCDLAQVPEGLAEELDAAWRPRGWEVHLHGRKLYAVPSAVDKRAALDFVLDRLEQPAFVAAGDSSLDHCLMEGADLALAPRGSELAALAPAGVTITRGEHVAAAEEILEAALGG